jgi:hypothetical protein
MNNELKKPITSKVISIITDFSELQNTMEAAKFGLNLTIMNSKLYRDFQVANEHLEENQRTLERITGFAESAQKQVDVNFSDLNSQIVVMLYAHLEAGIKNIILEVFKYINIAEIDDLNKMKISIKYIGYDEEEKMDHLFSEYESLIARGLSYGISRFEALLKPIGLSGDVDKKVIKGIGEFSQLRNLLLHKGGIVDTHFKTHCPWVNCRLKEKFIVTDKEISRYRFSVLAYLMTIVYRFSSPDDEMIKIKTLINEYLTNL